MAEKINGFDSEEYWHEKLEITFDFDDNEEDFTTVVPTSKIKFSHLPHKDVSANTANELTTSHSSEKVGFDAVVDSSLPSTQLIEDHLISMKLEPRSSLKDIKNQTSPIHTVKRMVLGQIVLFLKRTLKQSVFIQEVLQRPEAVSHYLYYLKSSSEFRELLDLLVLLGRTDEAGMLNYKLAIKTAQPEKKLKLLQHCQRNHFQSDPSLSMYFHLLSEQISLLERQLPIEENDIRQEKEGINSVFQEIPRPASLVNNSVITTLYYCCLYHWELPENNFASPQAIKKAHQLTDKQFVWTALGALTQRQQWKEIENLFQSKSWLGGTKMRCCIGFDKVVDVLCLHKAPIEVVAKYLKLVDGLEKRLNLAKKYKCHQVVVDTLVLMKDRLGLEDYKQKLLPHSTEHLYLQEALRASTIKWKN
ncbi:vacuolar protein sorting 16B isoform X3 [Tachypleus tridentatus]|uniref:vacuolar protein sorting 16B isoform X3 n=1 Tax=Tachypleus tridentatus TaxID=6853 RepID=UPI003FD07085